MNNDADALTCDNAVFGGLTSLFNAAIFRGFPELSVDVNDLEDMVAMLEALRPELAEIALFHGLIAVGRRDWRAALGIFQSLRDRGLCEPSSGAMVALCLNNLDDPSWRSIADELLVHQGAGASHRQLVSALAARSDLKRATEDARITGVYTEPDSVRELVEQNLRKQEAALRDAATESGATRQSLPYQGAYLRV